jgi:hypothetical protein
MLLVASLAGLAVAWMGAAIVGRRRRRRAGPASMGIAEFRRALQAIAPDPPAPLAHPGRRPGHFGIDR